MYRQLQAMGNRLLDKLVPRIDAAAAETKHCWWQYKHCDWCHDGHKCKRMCCREHGHTECGEWQCVHH